MALYLLSDPPEVAHLPWRQRERLRKAASEQLLRQRPYHSVALGLIFFGILDLFGACPLLPTLGLLGILLPLVVGFLLIAVLILEHNRAWQRALCEEVMEQGIRPHACPRCLADLANSTGDACPRCHTNLVVHRCPTCGQPTASGSA